MKQEEEMVLLMVWLRLRLKKRRIVLMMLKMMILVQAMVSPCVCHPIQIVPSLMISCPLLEDHDHRMRGVDYQE